MSGLPLMPEPLSDAAAASSAPPATEAYNSNSFSTVHPDHLGRDVRVVHGRTPYAPAAPAAPPAPAPLTVREQWLAAAARIPSEPETGAVIAVQMTDSERLNRGFEPSVRRGPTRRVCECTSCWPVIVAVAVNCPCM
mmetsp:Transcript_11402/g.26201  ORF Transcript_11402/g.26201 Transcript_11402/m.26201 type:complete len:137 (-) Transcript_11402:43-453(-)